MDDGRNYGIHRQHIIPGKAQRRHIVTPEVTVARAIADFSQACHIETRANGDDCRSKHLYNADHTNSPFSGWEAGRRYMTRAGFRVRSKVEKIIADFLHIEGFKFIYEPRLQVGEDWISPDFYLTELDLPYEHFGMNHPKYLHRAETKIARYTAYGVPFVYTTFKDEPDLEDVLTEKLVDFY